MQSTLRANDLVRAIFGTSDSSLPYFRSVEEIALESDAVRSAFRQKHNVGMLASFTQVVSQ